jgi:hypothetical protein
MSGRTPRRVFGVVADRVHDRHAGYRQGDGRTRGAD